MKAPDKDENPIKKASPVPEEENPPAKVTNIPEENPKDEVAKVSKHGK
ncbi:MAG: hypothetical protein ABIP97_04870 [Chthoniobacterales bacterium]